MSATLQSNALSGQVSPDMAAVDVGTIVVPTEAITPVSAPQEADVSAPAATPAQPPAPALVQAILPAPRESMRETFVSSAARDVKRFTWLLMLGVTLLSGYHVVRLRYFDPRDYYASQGVAGPYEVLSDDAGHTDPGPTLTVARPGQQFGWLAALCLNEGVSVAVSLDLVRLPQPGFPEAVVAHRDSVLTPDSRRCGTRFNVWSVPAGALPGQYEVRRRLTVRPGAFAISQDLSPVPLAVLALPPPSAARPPQPDRSAYKIDL